MTDVQSPTRVFRDARDLLLRHREDYLAARAELHSPMAPPSAAPSIRM